MSNLLLFPAVVGAVLSSQIETSASLLVDGEFGIQEPLTVGNRPYKQRSVRISLPHVGTSSWLLGEQHPKLEASAPLPKAVPKCWQAQWKEQGSGGKG